MILMSQIDNKEEKNNNRLKDWQADACINVMLFCCRTTWLPVSNTTKWDFSKICRLYELLGDIYNDTRVNGLVDAMNLKFSKYYENPHFDFITNCRLVRDNEREKLHQICSAILTGHDDFWSNEMKRIIEKELQFS